MVCPASVMEEAKRVLDARDYYEVVPAKVTASLDHPDKLVEEHVDDVINEDGMLILTTEEAEEADYEFYHIVVHAVDSGMSDFAEAKVRGVRSDETMKRVGVIESLDVVADV